MKEIPVSEFKKTCRAVFKEMQRTGEPVIVTRFGEALAVIRPPSPGANAPTRLGTGEGSLVFLKDPGWPKGADEAKAYKSADAEKETKSD